ncbi:MAG: hypothetical protein JNG84_06585 [Archangium sp.]|nr:hypothetical protein [Archangium sp.]
MHIIEFPREQVHGVGAMRALALAHRVAGGTDATEAERVLIAQWRENLQALELAGWNGALGSDVELPEQLMPAAYRERRQHLLDQLQNDLMKLAAAWRQTHTPSDAAPILADYERVYAELDRIGHWSGDPGFDAALPDDLMPQAYRDMRETDYAHYRSTFPRFSSSPTSREVEPWLM